MQNNQEFNPFKLMLQKPRETMRVILDGDKEIYAIELIIIASFLTVLNILLRYFDISQAENIVILIATSIALGFALSMALYYSYTSLIRWSGDFFNGINDVTTVRSAIAWSSYPFIFVNLVSIFFILSPSLKEFEFIVLLLGAYALYLSLNIMAEAQGYSIFYAFINMAIAIVSLIFLLGIIFSPFIMLI